MDNLTWTHSNVSDVYNNGANYTYSLLLDYSAYIKNFGYISIEQFLPQWTCITYKSFQNLKKEDIVYDYRGTKFIVMDDPYESDEGTDLYVEVLPLKEDGTIDISNS